MHAVAILFFIFFQLAAVAPVAGLPTEPVELSHGEPLVHLEASGQLVTEAAAGDAAVAKAKKRFAAMSQAKVQALGLELMDTIRAQTAVGRGRGKKTRRLSTAGKFVMRFGKKVAGGAGEEKEVPN